MEEKFCAEKDDVIEIIPSHYVPSHPIGSRYVVVGSLDGYDAEIINEKGEYATVCGEDYKVIGNIADKRKDFWDKVPKKNIEPFDPGRALELIKEGKSFTYAIKHSKIKKEDDYGG